MIYNNDHLFCIDLPTTPKPEKGKILVTGATGYIGGRLVPELIARGYDIRVMVRAITPEMYNKWQDVEFVVADARNLNQLRIALEGIHIAYYLIHSLLLGQSKFVSTDALIANNFRRISEEKNISRIIYLSGLGNVNTKLSHHLSSRLEVAKELSKGKVPVTTLRSAIIIGSGSASYKIIKQLVINSPIILLPPWAKTKCQPIGIRDIIKYLVGILEHPDTAAIRNYDIGGKEILSYEEMLKIMVHMLHKKRIFLHVPFSDTFLLGNMISLFTDVQPSITKCLIDGCKNEVICCNNDITKILDFEPLSYKEAVLRALTREEQDRLYPGWSLNHPPAHALALKLREIKRSVKYVRKYSLLSIKSPDYLFHSLCTINGNNGWFNRNRNWKLRSLFDKVISGIKSTGQNISKSGIQKNDIIETFIVEDIKPNKLLLLRAEMKLPGRAWLKFEIKPKLKFTKLTVKVYFQSKNLLGKIFWHLLIPFHSLLFKNLIRQIETNSLSYYQSASNNSD